MNNTLNIKQSVFGMDRIIFIIGLLILPFHTFAQGVSKYIQFEDDTNWNGNDIAIFNGEGGEKSFVILDSLGGSEKSVEGIKSITWSNQDEKQRLLEPVMYHGTVILSERYYESDRISIYDGGFSGNFLKKPKGLKNYHYTKDQSNMRHVDYTNLYEDLYENPESRTYLIKADRIRKTQNVMYGVGGVLLAHAMFNIGYNSDGSKFTVPISLFLSVPSFIVPRLIQKPKYKCFIKALEVYN